MSHETPITGTPEQPIEQIPTDPSTFVDWLVLLGGPAIWITHFMVVYLAGEAACAPTAADQYQAIGDDVLVLLTVVATVIAAVACAGMAWAARRHIGRRRTAEQGNYSVDMARAGFLLALGALIGVISVGIPVIYLSPLC